MVEVKAEMNAFMAQGPQENDRGAKLEDSGVAVWFCEDIPEFFGRKLASAESPVVAAAAAIMDAPSVEFLSAKPVCKTGKIKFASPWHQDWMYWTGAPKLSVWLAVDDAEEENGCLKVLPGSHSALLDHGSFAQKEGFDFRASDDAVDRMAADLGRSVVSVPLASGSAIFFSDMLAHASHPNTSGDDRYSLIPTYRSGQVDDTSSTWATSRRLEPH
eukprot:g4502.t1